MSNIKPLLLLIALSITSTLHANEMDLKIYEPVFPSAYSDMLREAAIAYGKKDYSSAFTQFKRTACAGDKQSQSALGRMYIEGQGVTQNDLTGYAWLKVAAEFIYPRYQSVVRELEESMTPAQKDVTTAKVAALMKNYSMGPTGMSCSIQPTEGGFADDQIVCDPERDGNQVLLRRCDPADFD